MEGRKEGLNCVFSFCHTRINKLWDNYEGCDLISSFPRAMLTSPSARRSFLSVEAKDELPPLFFSVCGGTGKQVGPQARIDRHTGLVEAGVGVVGVAAV